MIFVVQTGDDFIDGRVLDKEIPHRMRRRNASDEFGRRDVTRVEAQLDAMAVLINDGSIGVGYVRVVINQVNNESAFRRNA